MRKTTWTTVDDGSTRWFVVAEQKDGQRDKANTGPSHNSTLTTMDELDHQASKPSSTGVEGDEEVEMASLDEIATSPQKDIHAIDDDSETSDDEDDAGRGLLVSGSQHRRGQSHARSSSLSKGIDVWQQVKNIVIEVSRCPQVARQSPSCSIDCAYAPVHNSGNHVYRRVDGERSREHPLLPRRLYV